MMKMGVFTLEDCQPLKKLARRHFPLATAKNRVSEDANGDAQENGWKPGEFPRTHRLRNIRRLLVSDLRIRLRP